MPSTHTSKGRLWASKPSCYSMVCCGFMPSALPLGTSVLGILAQAGSSCSSAAQATIVELISSKGQLPELCILALQFALPDSWLYSCFVRQPAILSGVKGYCACKHRVLITQIFLLWVMSFPEFCFLWLWRVCMQSSNRRETREAWAVLVSVVKAQVSM